MSRRASEPTTQNPPIAQAETRKITDPNRVPMSERIQEEIRPKLDPFENWDNKPRKTRIRMLTRVLERTAALGDANAAKAALAHLRWETEMKEGRPAGRGEHPTGLSITIVDDITGKHAVRIETTAARPALPPPGDTEEGQET